jgi:TetR/AcrR family transcriptional regulator, transcriptional repressor for nem operon
MKKTCNTREKLLEVAFDLIWDSSYGSVSVEDICQRAGVNKGSFYHFFPTKSDLAVEAYRDRWETARPLYEEIFAPDVAPLERLDRWCDHILSVQREKAAEYGHVCGCPFATVGAELATQDERIRASSEELIYAGRKYVETAIADALREGTISAVDPAQLSRRIYSVCLGMLFEARVQNKLEILLDLKPAIFESLGIKAPGIKAAALPV